MYALFLASFWFCRGDAVLAQKGIPFAERGKTVLRMDLYESENPAAPWLVFAHGGGFSGGSRDADPVVTLAQGLAQRGIHVASISYRLRQRGVGFGCDVPVADKRQAMLWAAEDVGAAVRAIRQRGAEWIAVGGASAGAEAAMLWGFQLGRESVGAVVSFSGAIEPLETDWNQLPSFIAFHGTCDAIVPYDQAIHRHCDSNAPGAFVLQGPAALHACAEVNGGQAFVVAYEGAGHEVCNEAMIEPHALDALAQFIHDAVNGNPLPSTIVAMPSGSDCNPTFYLPCAD